MVNAAELFTRQAKPFGALRANRNQDGLETQPAQVIQREVRLHAHTDITVIAQPGSLKHLPELGTQTFFHGKFIRVDAIFSQPAGFDIAIKNDDFDAIARQFAGRKHPRRACANYGHVKTLFSHVPSPCTGKTNKTKTG